MSSGTAWQLRSLRARKGTKSRSRSGFPRGSSGQADCIRARLSERLRLANRLELPRLGIDRREGAGLQLAGDGPIDLLRRRARTAGLAAQAEDLPQALGAQLEDLQEHDQVDAGG